MSIEVTVSGNVGKAAEIRYTKSGQAITGFSLASTPREKKNGEWVDGETVWFSVSYFGNLPVVLLDKGSPVQVTGTLSQRTYESNGVTKTSFEIRANTVASIIRPVKDASAESSGSGWAAPAPASIDETPF